MAFCKIAILVDQGPLGSVANGHFCDRQPPYCIVCSNFDSSRPIPNILVRPLVLIASPNHRRAEAGTKSKGPRLQITKTPKNVATIPAKLIADVSNFSNHRLPLKSSGTTAGAIPKCLYESCEFGAGIANTRTNTPNMNSTPARPVFSDTPDQIIGTVMSTDWAGGYLG